RRRRSSRRSTPTQLPSAIPAPPVAALPPRQPRRQPAPLTSEAPATPYGLGGANGVFDQSVSDLVERSPQNPADVHLGVAEMRGDFGLGQAAHEPQEKHPSFAVVQVGDPDAKGKSVFAALVALVLVTEL